MASNSAVDSACAPRSTRRSRGRSERGSSRIVIGVILMSEGTKDLFGQRRSFAPLRMTKALRRGSQRRAVALLELLPRTTRTGVVPADAGPVGVRRNRRVQRACAAGAHDDGILPG